MTFKNNAVARVTLENVTKYFATETGKKVCAVNQLSLEIGENEFFVIVGPSGCGKTTILRLIAGLETPDSGGIYMNGVPLRGIAPKNRDVAMVFQNHALFPHLSAFENMAFGLILRKIPKKEIELRVQDAAQMLGLVPLLQRKPQALSGGECQRVALGRAMVRQPKIFLFDEPLSSLDAPMRVQLREQIMKIRDQVKAPLIYVTHDQAEALSLADRMAVLREGALEQVGTPQELICTPATPFVAQFFARKLDFDQNSCKNLRASRLC